MKVLYLMFTAVLGILTLYRGAAADPGRYPQYAQQHLPKGVTPEFIYLDQLVEEIVQKKRPMIVDVRTGDEYQESHITGSFSIPLGEIPVRLAEIPKDRLVVFY